MAFEDSGKAPVEQEIGIYQIGITLTSHNHLRKSEQSRSEVWKKNPRSEKCFHAYQDSVNHYTESTIQWRLQDLGSFPDVYSYVPRIAMQVTSISIEHDVEVEVSIADA